MSDKPETHRITVINIPENVYQKIKALMRQEKKSASAIALILLEDGLSFTDPTKDEIKEALDRIEGKLFGNIKP